MLSIRGPGRLSPGSGDTASLPAEALSVSTAGTSALLLPVVRGKCHHLSRQPGAVTFRHMRLIGEHGVLPYGPSPSFLVVRVSLALFLGRRAASLMGKTWRTLDARFK